MKGVNLFALIRDDHGLMLNSCRRIEQAVRGGKIPAYQDFLQRLREHLRVEELVVYRPLQEREEAMRLLAETIRVHRLLDRLADELEKFPPSDDRWIMVFEELEVALRAHIDDEEDTLFKKLRRFCRERQLEDLARDVVTFRVRRHAA